MVVTQTQVRVGVLCLPVGKNTITGYPVVFMMPLYIKPAVLYPRNDERTILELTADWMELAPKDPPFSHVYIRRFRLTT